ncbi:MAG: endonuclease/exonuclease/phosphatase family protein [Nocardioidaceae bacterium]
MSDRKPFTVMTLNLWGSNHWLERRAEVLAWISEEQPDVIALQEVERGADGQLEWLTAQTGMHHAFAGARRAGGPEFGNALLSRFVIESYDSLELPLLDRDLERRFALRARIATPDGLTNVYSTHLSHLFVDGLVREAQVVALADWIDVHATGVLPTILCGDLNAMPDSAEVRFLKGRQSLGGRSFHLFDALEMCGNEAPTWSNRNHWAALERLPDQLIDYIFVGVRHSDTGAGQVLCANLVCDLDRTGVFASDHFGVTANLYW